MQKVKNNDSGKSSSPILVFHIPFFSYGGMLEFIPAAPGEKQVNSPGHTITSEDVLAATTMPPHESSKGSIYPAFPENNL